MSNSPERNESREADASVGGYWLAAVNPQAPNLGLGEVIATLLDGKVILLSWLAIGAVLAVVASLLMTPVYRAEVLMMPVSNEQSESALAGMAQRFAGLSSLVGFGVDSSSEKHTALATLKSRAFTESFINDLNLMPVLFADEWDEKGKKWLSDDEDDVPTIREATEMFDEEIRRVSEDQRTGLITLAIEWEDREAAARWANQLVSRVNERIRQDVISHSQRSIEFLNRELAKTSITELQQAIYGLIETQVNRAMLASVREEYAFKVVDPAVVADADQYVRPQRLLLVLLGVAAGLTIGIIFVLLRGASRQSQEKRSH
ncbi:MAG: hypothetical protein HKN59_03675 [Gammaproteobacteria bacterium]|nr:hypothetical protein [Gammaproteobacteria bacterium]